MAEKASLLAPDQLRWAACSTAEFGSVGDQRHLVAKGALTTYCGHSASHPEIWRGNARKPACGTCSQAPAHLVPTEGARRGNRA